MAIPGSRAGRDGSIQTRWCVLTGAPCSGKTAVINELARRGHVVVHETAQTIESLLVKCYRGLGYPIIRIPVAAVSKRADLILEHLE